MLSSQELNIFEPAAMFDRATLRSGSRYVLCTRPNIKFAMTLVQAFAPDGCKPAVA